MPVMALRVVVIEQTESAENTTENMEPYSRYFYAVRNSLKSLALKYGFPISQVRYAEQRVHHQFSFLFPEMSYQIFLRERLIRASCPARAAHPCAGDVRAPLKIFGSSFLERESS
jgi:hypothetical protein